MASTPMFPSAIYNSSATLLQEHAARPRICHTPHGTTGSRIHSIVATTTHTIDTTLRFFILRPILKVGDLTGPSKPRLIAGGDYINLNTTMYKGKPLVSPVGDSNGILRIGARYMFYGCKSIANDVIWKPYSTDSVLSGSTYSGNTITVANGLFYNTEDVPDDAILYLVDNLFSVTLTGKAGVTIPPINCLNSTAFPSLTTDNPYLYLGAGEVLACSVDIPLVNPSTSAQGSVANIAVGAMSF